VQAKNNAPQQPGVAVTAISECGRNRDDCGNRENKLDRLAGAVADEPAHIHEHGGMKRHGGARGIAQHLALQRQRLGDVVVPALDTAKRDAGRKQGCRADRSPANHPPSPRGDQRKRKQHAKLRLDRQ
jgi:hypothetical protein